MDTRLYKWQKKLLPWMIILPSFLIVVFVVLATLQFRAFSSEIETYKSSELDKLFFEPSNSSIKIPPEVNKSEFVKLYVLARMDEQLMNKRYSQGGVLLLSRLYTKYLGFFTGMILAIVGAVFIIAKLTEQESKIEGSSGNINVSLVSASPGIIFGVLGTALMITTILQHTDIDIKDVSTYVHAGMFINTEPGSNGTIDSLMENSSPYKTN